MSYLLYLPTDYEQQESWPLLLFLHGSGERGDDLELGEEAWPSETDRGGQGFSVHRRVAAMSKRSTVGAN